MKRFYLFLFLLLASLVFSSPVLAADSTSFDPTKVMVQSVGASIPVGTVITWPSNSWPSDRDNWLECNGQSISSAVYPELTALVGSQVPDYRGLFLRGQGSQTSTHYGTVTHSSATLGQLQGDGIRTIWGTFVGGDWSGHDNQGGSSGAFWPAGNAGVQEGDDYNQIRYSFDVSRVTPVVGEVRPVNRVFGILSEQNNFRFKRKSQKNSPANRLRTQCTPARRCPAYPARHPTWHLYGCPHRPERTLFPEMG